MKTCGIYKITSPTNRIYIGQSVSIETRICKYRNLKCKEQPSLYRSLVKYGWEAHSVEIIETCDKCELDLLEVKYINQYNSCSPKIGMNIHTGGKSHITSESTKNKLRKSLKGINKGVKKSDECRIRMSVAAKNRSKETRLKISEKLKGRKPWNTGIPHPEETKIRIGIRAKKSGTGGSRPGSGRKRKNLLSELEKQQGQ
jgi:group I intron endonuclease